MCTGEGISPKHPSPWQSSHDPRGDFGLITRSCHGTEHKHLERGFWSSSSLPSTHTSRVSDTFCSSWLQRTKLRPTFITRVLWSTTPELLPPHTTQHFANLYAARVCWANRVTTCIGQPEIQPRRADIQQKPCSSRAEQLPQLEGSNRKDRVREKKLISKHKAAEVGRKRCFAAQGKLIPGIFPFWDWMKSKLRYFP